MQKHLKPSTPDVTLWRLPDVLAAVRVGKSTWWRWVAEGYAPQPVRLGKRCTCWRSSDIHAFIKAAGNDGQ